MDILLTGATGYVGRRLLPLLLKQGHHVTAVVRDQRRFSYSGINSELLTIIERDFSNQSEPEPNQKFDFAYYLIHSMGQKGIDFEELESKTANNFKSFANATKVRQVIYLGGIDNNAYLSKHLRSRQKVENILSTGNYALTTLKAGIIVGSGSSSFEIVRDLVEKLPVMVCPKWIRTKTQPIAASDVLKYLNGVLGNEQTYHHSYDIGGPEILTYKQLMRNYGKVRGLKTFIITVPLLTPRLSSYWLYFITASNYKIARNLVNSMRCETVCSEDRLEQLLKIQPITYTQAIENAFTTISQNMVVSSWKDAISSSNSELDINEHINVPTYGCFKNVQKIKLTGDDEKVLEKFWSIGGKNGWYYGTILWKLRGFFDKLAGGVGLRRGRKNQNTIKAGESLDFWRVLLADKPKKRLILFAEMKVPGEAWLEFHIKDGYFQQIATFRPKGLWGRIYWFLFWPFHKIMFRKMALRISKSQKT